MKFSIDLYSYLESHFSMTIEELRDKIETEILDVVEEFTVEKRNSDKRTIHKVEKASLLWRVQKILNEVFYSEMKFPDYVFGFQKHKSYFGFLNSHVNNNNSEKYFLKLDIKNFFDSIYVDDLIDDIIQDFEKDAEKKNELSEFLHLVLTHNGKLPQGFQTSPILSNFYFLRADLRIKKYCDKLGIRYSRYADDILLSWNDDNVKSLSSRTTSMIDNIINDFYLELNRAKTKSSKYEFCLNGYVISSEVRLSQKKLKELRRILFIIEHCDKKKNRIDILKSINSKEKTNDNNMKRSFSHKYLLNYLSGNRSFLISSLKGLSSSNGWYRKASSLITRIENAILRVY
jgi:RNA-directed DNA polymerase